LDLADAHGALRGTADMHIGLAQVMLERNDLAAATRHLEISSELGEHAGLPQHAYRWRVAAARLRRAEGDLVAAIELLGEAERVYNTDMSPPVRPVSAVKAQTQLALGDIVAAQRWAAERGLTANDDLTYLCEYEHITLARVLIASPAPDRESPDAAVGLLERLLVAAEHGGRAGNATEILIVMALAHRARGDDAAASAALAQALAQAETESYVRIFVEDFPALAPLLRATSPGGAAGAHAQRVIAAALAASAVEGPPVGSVPAALIDELSSRELDVLRLLRSDLNGPDIARELMVSVNTVRTHTKNIYMKLGVNNRREAVTRASELGL
jgi:LuxR family maltose regulon positive regulatory protein